MMTEREFTAGLVASQPLLMSIAMKYMRKRDRAQDLVQDTLLLAWEHRARFLAYEHNNLRGWVATILHRRAVSILRRERNPKVQFASLDTMQLESDIFAGPDEQEPRLHLLNTVRIMARLPRPQQDALVCEAYGMSGDRAARLMGIHIQAQKSRLCRARHNLRQAA